jgi:ankyrin repeat protein
MVQRLLESNANPNAALLSGETALMTCARAGSVAAVKALLVRGADVNAKETRSGQTALMWAVAERHPEVARELIEKGADVRARSKSGFTPLLIAARHGDQESARILLAAGADVNESTPEDGSALVVASGSGHEELAIVLLEKGADPNIADRFGTTALHYSMLKAIAPYQDITSSLAYLTYMFRPNMTGLVEALLRHGVNPNARLLKTPRLPNGKSAMLSLSGATPFWLAAAVGDVRIMQMLVEKGADPMLATEEKVTPLMAAAGLGRRVNGHMDRTATEEKEALEAVKFLVELGADVHASTETGLTAMHGAAYTGGNTIVRFLAERGAQVDVQDKFGQTPLTIAQRKMPPGLPNKFRSDQVYDKTVQLLSELAGSAATR